MIERPTRLSLNGAERQQELEVTRLAKVKGYIGYQSYLYSGNAPDQKDDIAQVAWEAVIKQLQDYPDCPINYLKVTAKNAIINYRKQGKSVDGKLDESGRPRTYDFLSLEAPIADDDTHLEEVLGEKSSVQRITEERALNRVLMEDLRSQLSVRENQALSMRLNGASWEKVTISLGRSAGYYRSSVRRRIEEAARRVLNTKPLSTNKT